jgi:tripartite-type tricarboxylate transporter receptor subunit TctC
MTALTRRKLLIGGAAAFAATRRARAAIYPDHPIRIVVPYDAGGLGQTIMQLLAVKMQQVLGQKLVIESKPGAGGNIGTIEVARSAPDGYTVLVAAANNYVINQYLFKLPLDPLTALTPIANVADVPLVLFSNPSVKAHNLKEFVELARTKPGQLSYGSPSVGTVNHLLMERLKQAAGINIVHIPFHGSPPAVLALLMNEIQLLPLGLGPASSYLRDGKLTTLAVATEKRLRQLPDTPTMIESGYPGFVASNWWGMAVPSGTPGDIVQALYRATTTALQEPNVISRFDTMGLVRPVGTPQQFAASLKQQAAVWRTTIERGKIVLQ